MNILQVNISLDTVTGGGMTERTYQLSRQFAVSGTDCSILTLDIGLTPERLSLLRGVQVISLPCLWKRFYVPRVSIPLLNRVIRRADIIHLMGHWTILNALVYLLARLHRKPYTICPAGALPLYGRSKPFKRFYNAMIGYAIVRNAVGYIAITRDEVAQFQAYGIQADAVSVIPNGIDENEPRSADDTQFRSMFGLTDTPFVLFVGRLNPIKGPDLLLNAFCSLKNELRDYHLVFAGPDEGMLPSLKNISEREGMQERVHFIGYIGGRVKTQAYHAADLLVVPSRQEAMSIVALEAGAQGTPVLLTDQCGFDEIERIGGGRVVRASVEGLRSGLRELLGKPEALHPMGEKLRQFTLERFTWKAAVEAYSKLSRRIVGESVQ